eukprot:1198763-Pleurochrysis_carterae.AAC.2
MAQWRLLCAYTMWDHFRGLECIRKYGGLAVPSLLASKLRCILARLQTHTSLRDAMGAMLYVC